MRSVPHTDHALFLFDLVLSVTLHVLMAAAVVSVPPVLSPSRPPLDTSSPVMRPSEQVIWVKEAAAQDTQRTETAEKEQIAPLASRAMLAKPAEMKRSPLDAPASQPLPPPESPREPARPAAMVTVPVPDQRLPPPEDASLAGLFHSLPKLRLDPSKNSRALATTESSALNSQPSVGLPIASLEQEGSPDLDTLSAPRAVEQSEGTSSEAARLDSAVGTGGNTALTLFETGPLEPQPADGLDAGLLMPPKAPTPPRVKQSPTHRPLPSHPTPTAPSAQRTPLPPPIPPREVPPEAVQKPVSVSLLEPSSLPASQPPAEPSPLQGQSPDGGKETRTAGQVKKRLQPQGTRGNTQQTRAAQPELQAQNPPPGLPVQPDVKEGPLLTGRPDLPPAALPGQTAQPDHRFVPPQQKAAERMTPETPSPVAKLSPTVPHDSSPTKKAAAGAEKGAVEGLDSGPEPTTVKRPEARKATLSAPPLSTPAPVPAFIPEPVPPEPRIEVTPPSLLQQLVARVMTRRIGARSQGTLNGGQLIDLQTGRIGTDHAGSGSPRPPGHGTQEVSVAGGNTALKGDPNSIGTIITAQSPYWEYGVQVQSRITQEFNRAGTEAREALSLTGRVTLLITLEKDGRVSGHTVTNGQDLAAQIRLAQAALARCRRFPPIPETYGVERLRFAATFDFGK